MPPLACDAFLPVACAFSPANADRALAACLEALTDMAPPEMVPERSSEAGGLLGPFFRGGGGGHNGLVTQDNLLAAQRVLIARHEGEFTSNK